VLDKSCFVIMPFRDKFDDIYHRIIKPAAEASGFRPVRADEVYSTRPVISDIFEGITNASAIIQTSTMSLALPIPCVSRQSSSRTRAMIFRSTIDIIVLTSTHCHRLDAPN
jgi:hypothetical protein